MSTCPLILIHNGYTCIASTMILALMVINKICFISFSPYKCIKKHIWLCHKVGQGQPRIIICANLVGPASQMLQAKTKRSFDLWFQRRRFLKDFVYHKWAWRPFWSDDLKLKVIICVKLQLRLLGACWNSNFRKNLPYRHKGWNRS